jgi:hypothetical protein
MLDIDSIFRVDIWDFKGLEYGAQKQPPLDELYHFVARFERFQASVMV